jgi:hypothetical protein
MRVFLDFEASSLAKEGYPIEVAWVFEDRRSETHLIRPAPGWTDWSAEAEALHGISLAALAEHGASHEEVARHMLETLSAHAVYVTAPSWDGKWLSLLLRAAGLPRHAMRLREADDAHLQAARQLLAGSVPADRVGTTAAAILAEVREAMDRRPPAHRALPDAERELEVWLEVGRRARAAARQGEGPPG